MWIAYLGEDTASQSVDKRSNSSFLRPRNIGLLLRPRGHQVRTRRSKVKAPGDLNRLTLVKEYDYGNDCTLVVFPRLDPQHNLLCTNREGAEPNGSSTLPCVGADQPGCSMKPTLDLAELLLLSVD